MQDMPTESVRLTEEEKKELLEYGGLTKGVREGVRLYLKAQKSQEIFRKPKTSKGRTPLRRPRRKRLN